jgi:hypothetical protein
MNAMNEVSSPYQEIGRINNVVALFQMDKANINYKDINVHDFSIEELDKSDEYFYDEHYFHIDNVRIIKSSKKLFQDMALKLLDLPNELTIYCDGINKKNGKIFKDSLFIITDGRKHLFVFTGGFSYPRFKAFIDKESDKQIKNILNK